MERTGKRWRTQSSLTGFDSRFPQHISQSYFCLQPTGEIDFSDEYVHEFTEDLKSIPADSVLYNILALDQPEQLGGVEVQIGQLVLRLAFYFCTFFPFLKLLQRVKVVMQVRDDHQFVGGPVVVHPARRRSSRPGPQARVEPIHSSVWSFL